MVPGINPKDIIPTVGHHRPLTVSLKSKATEAWDRGRGEGSQL